MNNILGSSVTILELVPDIKILRVCGFNSFDMWEGKKRNHTRKKLYELCVILCNNGPPEVCCAAFYAQV